MKHPCVDCGGLPSGRKPHPAGGLDHVCRHCKSIRQRAVQGDTILPHELFDDSQTGDEVYQHYRAVCLRLGYTLRTTEDQDRVVALHEAWGHALRVACVTAREDYDPKTKIPYTGAAWELARQEAQGCARHR